MTGTNMDINKIFERLKEILLLAILVLQAIQEFQTKLELQNLDTIQKSVETLKR